MATVTARAAGHRLLAIVGLVVVAAAGCADEVPSTTSPAVTTPSSRPAASPTSPTTAAPASSMVTAPASSTVTARVPTLPSTPTTTGEAAARAACEQHARGLQDPTASVARSEASTQRDVLRAFEAWGEPIDEWPALVEQPGGSVVIVCIIHGDALAGPFSTPPPQPGATSAACAGSPGYYSSMKVVVLDDGRWKTIDVGSRCNPDAVVNRLPSDEVA